MSAFIERIFGPGGWLGDGRFYVFTFILPLLCLAPWSIATGPQMYGKVWGFFSDVPVALVPFDPAHLDEALAARELVNRVHSLSTATLLAIAALAAIIVGWMTACREARSSEDRIVFGGAWLALITLLIVVVDPSKHGPRVYGLLGLDVFARTAGSIYMGKPLALLNGLLTAANLIVVFGGSTLAIAVTTLAASGSRLHTFDDLPTLERLRRRLDLILFTSALVLAIGLVDMKQWHAWPLPFVADPAAYAQLTNAFVAFQSVCYVGVLAGIYLPTAIVLDAARSRIRTQVGGGRPIADPATSPAASLSPTASPIDILLRTVTVLSPILVGPLATLVGLKFPV
jgi:hypothetical protein